MTDIEITRLSVAITDILVFISCMAAVYFLSTKGAIRKSLSQSYTILFLSVGVAALFGAIHHQWFEEATDFMGTIPKFITMVSIGYAAMNIWVISCELAFSGALQLKLRRLFRALMYAYILAVVIYEQKFWVAIVFYLPAVIFFLGTVSFRWIKYKESIHIWAVSGLVVTIIAASVQAFQISLIPIYINHSSFYHLIQLPGIYLLYRHAQECMNWLPNK